jgi:hypothetical protein
MSRLLLGFTLAFLGMLSRLLLGSMISDNNGMGGGGGGWGGGNTTGSACLTMTKTMINTTTTTNTTTRRMGRGHDGEQTTGGESNYDGRKVVCGPSVGGMGQRTLIVGPHTAAAIVIDDDNVNHR